MLSKIKAIRQAIKVWEGLAMTGADKKPCIEAYLDCWLCEYTVQFNPDGRSFSKQCSKHCPLYLLTTEEYGASFICEDEAYAYKAWRYARNSYDRKEAAKECVKHLQDCLRKLHVKV